MKNIIIISDLHCGHRSGLTPPDWQLPCNVENKEISKFGKIQKLTWDWFSEEIRKIGKTDLLIINGDSIEGKGSKSKGTELLGSDMLKQCDMAEKVIGSIKAKKIFMTYGTPYHTGDGEDFEDVIARRVKAEISDHHFIDVNGVIFDIKHKVGSSSVPHGRHTPIAREALWNDLWSLSENSQPNSDIIIRSHVHYFSYCGSDRKLAITTPALQSFGSKFGARQCSGVVNIGFIQFKIHDNGDYEWKPHILKNKLLKVLPLKA